MQRSLVERTLIDIGVPIQNKGFKYIVDAIMLLDTEEWKNPKWTSLYERIGMMNDATDGNVERAIRHGFACARNNKKTAEYARKYLGISTSRNSSTLKTLYYMLKKEQEETLSTDPSQEYRDEEIRRIVRDELKRILGGIA